MTLQGYAYILRQIAERTGAGTVNQIAKQPAIAEVYRVTVHYTDGHASDSIATLKRMVRADVVLEVVYQGHFDHKPIVKRLHPQAFESFVQQLRQAGFDKLSDQENVSLLNTRLILIERAAGSFIKSVVFSSRDVPESYMPLLDAVQTYVPEVMREIH